MIYMHKLPGQTSNFAAKILYQPVAKCRSCLKELLKDYNCYTFEPDKEWTKDEETQYRLKSKTAFAAFRALFCDKAQFESPRSAIETLSRSYKSGRASILLGTMTGWYADRIRGKTQEDDASYTFREGHTAADLHQALDPLIMPRPASDVPMLWPLVKEVYVGAPSSRVLRHLTTVDLPGTLKTSARSSNMFLTLV